MANEVGSSSYAIDATEAKKGADEVVKSFRQIKKAADLLAKADMSGFTRLRKAMESLKGFRGPSETFMKNMNNLTQSLKGFRPPSKTAIQNLRNFFRSLQSMGDIKLASTRRIAELATALKNFRAPGPEQAQRLQQFMMALQNIKVPQNFSRIATEMQSVAAASNTTVNALGNTQQAMQKTKKSSKSSNEQLDEFSNKFRQTGQAISVLHGPLGGIASRFRSFGMLVRSGGLAIGIFGTAITGMVFAFQRAVREFAAMEAALGRIEAVLKATSYQAGIFAFEVEDMARRVAKASLSSVTQMRNAATQILTFNEITSDTFERTLEVANDLAATGLLGLRTAARQLARAIQDPAENFSTLRRAGITFTDSQEDMIEALQKSGNLLGAQNLLLSMVEERMRGAAEGAAQGLAGTWDTLAQSTQELFIALGDTPVLLTAVEKAMNSISTAMDALAENANLVTTSIMAITAGFAQMMIMRSLKTLFIGLKGSLIALNTEWQKGKSAVLGYSAATNTATAATSRLSVAMRSLGRIMVSLPITFLIGAIAAGLVNFGTRISETDQLLDDLSDRMRQYNNSLEAADGAMTATQREGLLNNVLRDRESILERMLELQKERNLIEMGDPGSFSSTVKDISDFIGKPFESIESLFGMSTRSDMEKEMLEGVNQEMVKLEQALNRLNDIEMKTLETPLQKTNKASRNLREEMSDTIDEIAEFGKSSAEILEMSSVFQKADEMSQKFALSTAKAGDALEGIESITDKIGDWQEEIAEAGLTDQEKAAREYKQALREVESTANQFTRSIIDQRDMLNELTASQEENTRAVEERRLVQNTMAQIAQSNSEAMREAMRDERASIEEKDEAVKQSITSQQLLRQATSRLSDAEARKLAIQEMTSRLQQAINNGEEERAKLLALQLDLIERAAAFQDAIAGGSSDKGKDTLEDLKHEVDALQREIAARNQSEEAVRRLNAQLQMEETVRKAAENATGEQLEQIKEHAQRVADLTVELGTLEDALSSITDAQELQRKAQEESLSAPQQAAQEYNDAIQDLQKALESEALSARNAALAQQLLNNMRNLGQEATRKSTEEIDKEISAFRLSNRIKMAELQGNEREIASLNRIQQRTQLVAEAKELANKRYGEGSAKAQELIEKETRHIDRLMAIQRETDNTRILSERLNEVFGESFKTIENAFFGFIEGTTTGLEALANIARSVANDIIREFMRLQVIQPLMGMLGGGSGGGFLSMLFNAQGNAFNGGRHLQKYKDGGIVNGPTMFPMKNGAGLMGEAGPEAVMPLTRTPSGDLGVRSVGSEEGSGTNLNISTHVSLQVEGSRGGEEQDQQLAAQIGKQLDRTIESKVIQVLQNQMRVGNTLNRPF